METKTSVLVGLDSNANNTPVHRRYKKIEIDRENLFIKVTYNEFYLLGAKENLIQSDKNYIVKNVKQGEKLSQNGQGYDYTAPADYNGFDNWFDYQTGQLKMGVVIEGAVDASLEGIPMFADSGFVITQAS